MSENKSDFSSAGEIQYDAASTDDAALKTNDASYLLYYFCKSRFFSMSRVSFLDRSRTRPKRSANRLISEQNT